MTGFGTAIDFTTVLQQKTNFIMITEGVKTILREINSAIFYKAECNSDAFIKLGIILLLLSQCIIWGTRNTKVEFESLFTEQICVGFVPTGSNKNVS